ncbi:hypothetical protein COOONC_15580 [Cooperia oncophora]
MVRLQLTATSEVLLYEIINGQDDSLKWLAELCDDFGPRQLGSEALEDAIDWVLASLRSMSILNLFLDYLTGYKPRLHKLNILAIDGSPPGQVEGEVVVIRETEELQTRNVKGRIVVTAQNWTGYRTTMRFRKLAADAAKRGALALLVKSVTPVSLYTPHVGAGARGVSLYLK